jgi:hypothetical protein
MGVARKKLIYQSFRIIDLAKKSFQIFGFKGVIRKIFRNEDLEVPGFKVSGFQRVNLAE